LTHNYLLVRRARKPWWALHNGAHTFSNLRAWYRNRSGYYNLSIDRQAHTVHGIFNCAGAAWADRHHDFRYLRHPIRYATTPASLRRPPPRLGEHTDAILTEVGFATSEIEALRSTGVVA
jgi:hypothetical protein